LTINGQNGSSQALRIAAIDVGTNSIRLEVAESTTDHNYRVIDDERVPVRLGRGLTRTGVLDCEAMDQAALTVAHFRSIADGLGVDRLRVVATSAVREASNQDAFVALLHERAHVDLEVITAEQEARLAFLSVSRAFDLTTTDAAVIDIGGGSTELVLSSGLAIERIVPLPLGAVHLTEMFELAGSTIDEAGYRRMRRFIRKTMKRLVGRPPFRPHIVIGTGGTFTNLAAMSIHRSTRSGSGDALPFAVRGCELQRSEVKHWLDRLRKMTLRERTQIAGLNPQRADIIVPGLTIVDCALKLLGVNRLRAHDEGIRAGLLYEMMVELSPTPRRAGANGWDRLRSARHFAASCRLDHQHAEHVANLAVKLFDTLSTELGDDASGWATSENRELLYAAALLHDVGYHVNYSKHHKHSYHLIVHSALAGFTRREIELMANIARYHRGARPKLKHANFARLSPEDREFVRQLAALLRLAVGLDRSHAQRVTDLSLRCLDGLAIVDVEAEAEPQVELWGAEQKGRLFEDAFGLSPRFRWAAPAGAHAPNMESLQ
jgi:exopolyphosphatase/guanosine-5'-triphosphate,3'-diphosphate pyrophosphatase